MTELARIPATKNGPADATAKSPPKVAVTALTIDSNSSIYAAYSTGIVKIWTFTQNLRPAAASTSSASSPFLTKDSHSFQLVQEIDLSGNPNMHESTAILSLVVSADCKRLLVGCGDTVALFLSSITRSSANGTKRGKTVFSEVACFPFHKSLISSIALYGDRFLIAVSQDMAASLWSLSSVEAPLTTCFLGSPGFAAALMVDLDTSEVTGGGGRALQEFGQITSAVAVGLANG